jgi:hypothetical protein
MKEKSKGNREGGAMFILPERKQFKYKSMI